jgi:hypothetical protein
MVSHFLPGMWCFENTVFSCPCPFGIIVDILLRILLSQTIAMLQNKSLLSRLFSISFMSHKIVSRKILVSYINGTGKEELNKMFLNIKANSLNTLLVHNYVKIFFITPWTFHFSFIFVS